MQPRFHLLIALVAVCFILPTLQWSLQQPGYRIPAHPEVHPFKRIPPMNATMKVQLWHRGDVPPPFTLKTLSGSYSFQPGQMTPTVFYALDDRSSFQAAMWDHVIYLRKLFTESPDNTSYVFMAYNNADKSANAMHDRCVSMMQSMGYSQSKIDDWLSRLHFVVDPVNSLSSGNSFIPSILDQWTGSLTWANISIRNKGSNTISRLDSRWPWSPSMTSVFGSRNISIGWFGNGCADSSDPGLPPREDVKGKIALIAAAGLECSYADKVIAAEIRGAKGVIVYQDENEPLVDMKGLKYPGIPSTMITYSDGQAILNGLQAQVNVTVKFWNEQVSGFWFAVDSNSELQECGFIMYPSFEFITNVQQYLVFQQNLDEKLKLQSSTSVDVVLFNQTLMDGPIFSEVTLPLSPSEMKNYRLELEASLNCIGANDVTCPEWDRTLQLLVSCQSPPKDYQEIGRWITPFKRGAGRWVTDITSLIPLLSDQHCTFQYAINISGGGANDPWRPSASLHFLPLAESNVPKPTSIIPLFNGGSFKEGYNDVYNPFSFVPSANTKKVELFVVVTGHGCGTDCCSEFCATTHVFQFNEDSQSEVSKTLYNAGTPKGCANRVPSGVEPNEYGTWLYGRAGWCDGRNVFPWVTDVTQLVNLNETNQIDYFGLYQGVPPAISTGGYIIMYSYLVFYE